VHTHFMGLNVCIQSRGLLSGGVDAIDGSGTRKRAWAVSAFEQEELGC